MLLLDLAGTFVFALSGAVRRCGALVGAVLCFGLRVLAMKRGWQLPVADSDH